MAISKKHILDEIKRTACANGNRPLGRIRFEKETGIKQNDWRYYYVRWNDAIRDAGYLPNEKTKSYGDDDLLLMLIFFIREIGHFPIENEFRLKSRESSFPSDKTFRTHFGNKEILRERVVQFCKNSGQFNDVLLICKSINTDNHFDEPETQNAEQIGSVYLMKLGKFYKIGRSKDINRRERELAIQMPQRLETIHTIRTDDPAGIEEYWHKRFADKRQNGEWFLLNQSDIKTFRRRKFM